MLGRLVFPREIQALATPYQPENIPCNRHEAVHDIPQSRLAALLGRERPGAMEVPVAESPRTYIWRGRREGEGWGFRVCGLGSFVLGRPQGYSPFSLLDIGFAKSFQRLGRASLRN